MEHPENKHRFSDAIRVEQDDLCSITYLFSSSQSPLVATRLLLTLSANNSNETKLLSIVDKQ